MNPKLKIDSFTDWGFNFKGPLIVAGPCSAESEYQVLETAQKLVAQGVHVFRAGVWKPRTRPGSFEGMGTVALEWLQKVRKVTGLPVAVEVASPLHAEECLKHDIDVFWIGARTTVNPFAVQELAGALKGINVPVLVKNPINPDIELWIGALERLNRAGLTKLVAVHRGFHTYHKKNRYRNIPNWNIVVELKRRIPNIQILCDPSHICGNRELLETVSQTAMDLMSDGLMIESHFNPDEALSDSLQQITPEELGILLKNIKIKREFSPDEEVVRNLEQFRGVIDDIDHQIIKLLKDRMTILDCIVEEKRKSRISSFQPSRWKKMIDDRVQLGDELELSNKYIISLFQTIHEESIRHQGTPL